MVGSRRSGAPNLTWRRKPISELLEIGKTWEGIETLGLVRTQWRRLWTALVPLLDIKAVRK